MKPLSAGKVIPLIIISAVSITVVLGLIFAWRSGTLPEWPTPQLLIQIAIIIVTIVAPVLGGLFTFYSSRPKLRVEVVRCVHSVRHSLVEKRLTGTELRVNLLVKNNGEKTSIFGARIECKSEKYPYRKEDKETEIFVVAKGDTMPYKHSFFISKYEILDLQLKFVLWLIHTYGRKEVNVESLREAK